MYHAEAPRLRDKWREWFRRPFAPPDYQAIRVGDAVAASSCVPGPFRAAGPVGPVRRQDGSSRRRRRVRQPGRRKPAGAGLQRDDRERCQRPDGCARSCRAAVASACRCARSASRWRASRQAQFQELDARRRSGLLKGLMFLHLRKDLDADPVDWRECQDPHEASDEARPAARGAF